MKQFTPVLFLLIAGCTQNIKEESARYQLATQQESQARVAEIISQLKEDCDSSLMQTAYTKVDSIKRKRLITLKK